MAEIYVKPNIDPAAGQPYQVRLPDKPREFLPEEGKTVEKSKYWVRRLRDLSVVEVKPPKAVKATTIKE